MHVLVTGCGGFLGSEIVRQLIRRGEQVRGLSRSECPELVRQGMEWVRGDIRSIQSVADACRGVDAVIHTAAKAGVWGPWEEFYQTNAVATQHVVDVCQQQQIGVLIFTSSPSVTFDGRDQQGVDESAPYPQRWLCPYPQTKALGEQAVLSAHQPGSLHTAALRPHLIWGKGDPHLFPRLIDRARRGRLRIVGDGENVIDTVHVVNAAAAHLNALDTLRHDQDVSPPPAGGRAYFITQDEPVKCWDWIGTILQLAGVEPLNKRIGFRTAWRLGAALERIYAVTRRHREPPMTRFVAAQLAKDHYFDISAAKSLLGYRPSLSTAEGLDELRGTLG